MLPKVMDDAISIPVSDPVDIIEYCYQQGWTDGLPVVPPLPRRVQEMLEAGGRAPDEVMGFVKFVRRQVTVKKIAINAVMAGCLPEYFPVILACVEGMLADNFGLHLAAASTHSPAIMPVINGPIRNQLDVNCAKNAFSPGWRANATIGRSLRLILMNVLGYSPRYFDNGTMGNPAKYSYCVGEYEEVSPWEPLHIERGFPPGSSAVTLFAAEPLRQTSSRRSREPEIILLSAADMIATLGTATSRPDEEGFLIVISPEHAAMIGARGWKKNDIKQFLFEESHRPLFDFKRAMRLPGEIEPGDETRMTPMMRSADDIVVMVAGGLAGMYTLVIPIWIHNDDVNTIVTKEIKTLR